MACQEGLTSLPIAVTGWSYVEVMSKMLKPQTQQLHTSEMSEILSPAENFQCSTIARRGQRPIHHGAATSTALCSLLNGEPLTGRVLGASPAGLYLYFESFEIAVAAPNVVALLPTSSVRLPLAMVSASPLPVTLPDSSVVVGDGALRVGGDVWRTVRWFDPRPSSCGAARPSLLANAARLLHDLSDAEVGLSAQRAWAAAAALALGDPEPCCGLLGAGPGLTPAGDDVVAGAIAACVLSGAGLSPRAVAMLLAAARAATTALSTALLSCAAAGQVVPPAAVLFRALSGAVPLEPALRQLRAVGGTSGTALALGLVAALQHDNSSQLNRLGQLDRRRQLAGSAGSTERG